MADKIYNGHILNFIDKSEVPLKALICERCEFKFLYNCKTDQYYLTCRLNCDDQIIKNIIN